MSTANTFIGLKSSLRALVTALEFNGSVDVLMPLIDSTVDAISRLEGPHSDSSLGAVMDQMANLEDGDRFDLEELKDGVEGLWLVVDGHQYS